MLKKLFVVVRLACHVCALLPLEIEFVPVAAVMAERADAPPPLIVLQLNACVELLKASALVDPLHDGRVSHAPVAEAVVTKTWFDAEFTGTVVPFIAPTVVTNAPEVVTSPDRSPFVMDVVPENLAIFPEAGVPVVVTVPLPLGVHHESVREPLVQSA